MVLAILKPPIIGHHFIRRKVSYIPNIVDVPSLEGHIHSSTVAKPPIRGHLF